MLLLTQMVGGSTALPLLLVVDMAALLLYNFSGMCVTGALPRRDTCGICNQDVCLYSSRFKPLLGHVCHRHAPKVIHV